VRTAPGESVFLGIERGEPIKHRNECGERSLGLGLASWLVVRSLPDCEGGGKGVSLSGEERLWRRQGSEGGEAGRRVQEVQTQTPRSGLTDPRRKVRGEPNAGVRSQIPRPDFVVHRGPEEVPEERPDLQRRRPPRDDQGQSDRVDFSFREASASFQAERFFCLSYRSAGDLACKRPVRPI
jgi:hypothetical protein